MNSLDKNSVPPHHACGSFASDSCSAWTKVPRRSDRDWRGPALLCALMLLTSALAGCSGSSSRPQNLNTFVNSILHHFKGKSPVMQTRRMFDTSDADERMAGMAWLARQKYGHDKPYMRAYKLLTTDPNPLVRGQAMIALGTSHQPSVAPTLLLGLKDKSKFVRMSAAMGLTYVNNPMAIGPLLDHLRHDSDMQVRIYCAQALKYYKTRRVIRALIATLDDRNVALVQFAWSDLTRQTGQKLPQHSGPWRVWFKRHEGSLPHAG